VAETQGIDDACIQPYSGHSSRESLEVYSRIALADAQQSYEDAIDPFPFGRTSRRAREGSYFGAGDTDEHWAD
jgi:hypothetical protein